jgi:hypothetical protein
MEEDKKSGSWRITSLKIASIFQQYRVGHEKKKSLDDVAAEQAMMREINQCAKDNGKRTQPD